MQSNLQVCARSDLLVISVISTRPHFLCDSHNKYADGPLEGNALSTSVEMRFMVLVCRSVIAIFGAR